MNTKHLESLNDLENRLEEFKSALDLLRDEVVIAVRDCKQVKTDIELQQNDIEIQQSKLFMHKQKVKEIKRLAKTGQLISDGTNYDYKLGKLSGGWRNQAQKLKIGDSATFSCIKDARNFYHSCRRLGYKLVRHEDIIPYFGSEEERKRKDINLIIYTRYE